MIIIFQLKTQTFFFPLWKTLGHMLSASAYMYNIYNSFQVPEKDLNDLYVETSIFRLASHVYWAIWALIQVSSNFGKNIK